MCIRDSPYTFQDEQENQARKNPYIYKNQSGKLVCKLCNTMHTSWSSVERHIGGKKHGLNVLRRGNKQDRELNGPQEGNINNAFQEEVYLNRKRLRNNGVVPSCKVVDVKDPETDNVGIAIQVNYAQESMDKKEDVITEDDTDRTELFSPFIRIVSGLELASKEAQDKKFLVIAYEPFANIAVEIPNKEVVFGTKEGTVNNNSKNSVDEINGKCTYWDKDSKLFYVQVFFK